MKSPKLTYGMDVRVRFVDVTVHLEGGSAIPLGTIRSSGRNVQDAWHILQDAIRRDFADREIEEITYDDWRAA